MPVRIEQHDHAIRASGAAAHVIQDRIQEQALDVVLIGRLRPKRICRDRRRTRQEDLWKRPLSVRVLARWKDGARLLDGQRSHRGNQDIRHRQPPGQATQRPTLQLQYRARVEQPAANGRVFLICATERYAFLDVAPAAAGALIDGGDGAWREGRLAVMCPAATRLVQVELRSERGTVDVDRLSLREARPAS